MPINSMENPYDLTSSPTLDSLFRCSPENSSRLAGVTPISTSRVPLPWKKALAARALVRSGSASAITLTRFNLRYMTSDDYRVIVNAIFENEVELKYRAHIIVSIRWRSSIDNFEDLWADLRMKIISRNFKESDAKMRGPEYFGIATVLSGQNSVLETVARTSWRREQHHRLLSQDEMLDDDPFGAAPEQFEVTMNQFCYFLHEAREQVLSCGGQLTAQANWDVFVLSTLPSFEASQISIILGCRECEVRRMLEYKGRELRLAYECKILAMSEVSNQQIAHLLGQPESTIKDRKTNVLKAVLTSWKRWTQLKGAEGEE